MVLRTIAGALLFGLCADAAAWAQDQGQPPDSTPPDVAEQVRRLQGRGLPADTDSVAVDTAAVDDVAARRQALSEGEFPQRDDIFTALSQLPGFRALEYRGATVDLDLEREIVRLNGEAQANYTDAVLRADSITYLARSRFISARGDIALAGTEQSEVVSDSGPLYYDVETLKGTIFDAETQFAERGATWTVRGDAIPAGADTLFVLSGSFTSCELDEPHYTFSAGEIKLVNQYTIVARPVILYVGNVPVAWLPFFAQDIRPGRRSGIIPPQIGINDLITNDNFSRQITDFGYYWAINEFMDAQFTVDWFSGNFTRINGSYRYKFLKNFIDGNLGGSYSFGPSGRDLNIRLNHNQKLAPETDFRAKIDYVQREEVFVNQSFDPREQTSVITSDIGFNQRFGFGNASLSARRVQPIQAEERTELTLPSLNFTFSPVTLFRAPANRQGLLNNIVWSGSANFSRTETTQELSDDTRTTGTATSSFTIRNFRLSTRGNFNETLTTPKDSVGNDLDEELRSTITWNADLSYRIPLVGSTVLSPTVSVDGAQFRSDSTGRSFVSAPSRFRFGASLTTDVFGFLPGFGPFSRIRHKISPSFDWRFAPAVTVDSALANLPGFPVRSGDTQNTLTIGLNQTFEAKLKREVQEEVVAEEEAEREAALEAARAGERPGPPRPPPDAPEPDALEPDPEPGAAEPEAAPDAALPEEVAEADSAALADAVEEIEAADPEASPEVDAELARALRDSADAPPRRRPVEEQSIVLLGLRSTPLVFDFEAEGPSLISQSWGTSITSDLLRGLAANLTFDLFEGTGAERDFKPFLSQVSASFGFGSTQSLGQLFGVGRSGRDERLPLDDPSQISARDRLSTFEGQDRFEESPGSGPWRIQFSYSLVRPRPEEGGSDRQSVNGSITMQPTPKWRMRWRTSYDLSNGEFGAHIVNLERDLHRWQASFGFSKAPNGNFLFQFSVGLKDAPDLQFGYDTQTNP